MNEKDWSRLWHHRQLNVSFLQAFHSVRAYPRHSHDYYVVAVVDSGIQSFTYRGTKYVTPTNGLILLNPEEVHTGEPVDEDGFVYRAFYPTIEHMKIVSAELGGDSPHIPFFSVPRADDPQMSWRIRSLFSAVCEEENALESETRFLLILVELIKRYGGQTLNEPKTGVESGAVQKVREYIHDHYDQPISLSQLAEQVNFSRYYLLHTFRNEVGMPPHRYLDNVRVRQAQRLLLEGESLAQVAYQVGFGSQSHFTQRFKQIIGVTPGAYARQLKTG